MNCEKYLNKSTSEGAFEERCWKRDGWDSCKKEVLKILKKPLKNLDLSEDYCDSRYIEEIEKL
jgi:hypothetical protein